MTTITDKQAEKRLTDFVQWLAENKIRFYETTFGLLGLGYYEVKITRVELKEPKKFACGECDNPYPHCHIPKKE